MEGDKCSMPRDCCSAHECIEGDWGTSTDFTCQRVGEKPSIGVYKERMRAVYEAASVDWRRNGGDLALESTLSKWEGREERLFHVLLQKYPPAATHDEL